MRRARSRRSWWSALALGLFTVLPLTLLGSGPAWAGGSVGARFGWADAGDEVFKGSGDLGGTNLVGIQLAFDLLPLISTEIAGEYVSESFGFSEGVFEGIKAAGSGDYEDLGLYVSGRFDLFSLVLLPIKGYAGGGLNVHFVDLKIDDDIERVTAAAKGIDDDLEDAVQKVAGEQTRLGWHLVAGLRLSFIGGPLSIFVEGRFSDAFEEEGVPQAKSLYGGVNISL